MPFDAWPEARRYLLEFDPISLGDSIAKIDSWLNHKAKDDYELFAQITAWSVRLQAISLAEELQLPEPNMVRVVESAIQIGYACGDLAFIDGEGEVLSRGRRNIDSRDRATKERTLDRAKRDAQRQEATLALAEVQADPTFVNRGLTAQKKEASKRLGISPRTLHGRLSAKFVD